MIRAVVDSNILIRALIKPGGSVGPVLTSLRAGIYQLITSEPLLDELIAKLALPRIRGKYNLIDEDIETVLAFIALRGRIVTPDRAIRVCRDPKDDMVLEAAVAGEADYIVTGDEDVVVLGNFEGIEIVGTRPFIEGLEAGE
jgi:putative PIN family toxin of toxin-antitoxin system